MSGNRIKTRKKRIYVPICFEVIVVLVPILLFVTYYLVNTLIDTLVFHQINESSSVVEYINAYENVYFDDYIKKNTDVGFDADYEPEAKIVEQNLVDVIYADDASEFDSVADTVLSGLDDISHANKIEHNIINFSSAKLQKKTMKYSQKCSSFDDIISQFFAFLDSADSHLVFNIVYCFVDNDGTITFCDEENISPNVKNDISVRYKDEISKALLKQKKSKIIVQKDSDQIGNISTIPITTEAVYQGNTVVHNSGLLLVYTYFNRDEISDLISSNIVAPVILLILSCITFVIIFTIAVMLSIRNVGNLVKFVKQLDQNVEVEKIELKKYKKENAEISESLELIKRMAVRVETFKKNSFGIQNFYKPFVSDKMLQLFNKSDVRQLMPNDTADLDGALIEIYYTNVEINPAILDSLKNVNAICLSLDESSVMAYVKKTPEMQKSLSSLKQTIEQIETGVVCNISYEPRKLVLKGSKLRMKIIVE